MLEFLIYFVILVLEFICGNFLQLDGFNSASSLAL